MKTTIKNTTALILATLALLTPMMAQDGLTPDTTLTLSFSSDNGIANVYSFMSVGDEVEIDIKRPADELNRSGKLMVVYSGVQELGALDPKSTSLWFEARIVAGKQFKGRFTVPKEAAGRLYSVQAFIIYEDNSVSMSPVVTAIFEAAENGDEGEGEGEGDTEKNAKYEDLLEKSKQDSGDSQQSGGTQQLPDGYIGDSTPTTKSHSDEKPANDSDTMPIPDTQQVDAGSGGQNSDLGPVSDT